MGIMQKPTLFPALLAVLVLAGCASTPSVETKASAPSVVGATPTPAESLEVEHNQQFARWVAEFSTRARAAGVDEATLHSAFDNVRLVPSAIVSDRAQPEFTRAVWDYLDSAVSPQRVSRGEAKLQQLRSDGNVNIDTIAARYGVPAEVLVAIWGLESSYGSFVGDIPTIDALATLGFEGRREEWARGQLLAALKILQNRDIDRAQMIGSWAGAMGQTQFLPSAFLAFAVDADGDGRRDIWGSVPDVMASTANYLAHAGRPFWSGPTSAPSFATTMRPVMRWPSTCWRSGWPVAPGCRHPGRARCSHCHAARCWQCRRC
jgi:lytic murein transglycosylase